MHELVIVFTRFPAPGRVKTRLIPALGADGAAAVHHDLTRHTLAWADELAASQGTAIEVRYDGGDETAIANCFGDRRAYAPQGDGDLGDRLVGAIDVAAAGGASRIIVVGTDCPGLTAAIAGEAFAQLVSHDLVLGPATDGGYYLIGLRRPCPELFRGIAWGGDRVLADTRAVADRLGLKYVLLPPLPDVDLPEDLVHWRRIERPTGDPRHTDRISVVIPARDEAARLGDTLRPLVGAADVETIVVDGGSADETLDMARRAGCRAFCTSAGRATQMNAGAATAGGGILLFLHADTRLPDGFERHVRESLADPRTTIGAFRLRFEAAGTSLRTIAAAANLRTRWLGLPYGDQAQFCRVADFWRVGGFPDWPLLEDVALVRALRRHGRLAIAPDDAVTSARRYNSRGPWRTVLRNQAIMAGYFLGVSPARLAAWHS